MNRVWSMTNTCELVRDGVELLVKLGFGLKDWEVG